jgi:hypothetical protein
LFDVFDKIFVVSLGRFLAHITYFGGRNEISLIQYLLCVCYESLYPPILSSVSLDQFFYETWYVYYGTSARLNGVLHKSLPLVHVCVSLLSLLGNGSVKTFPPQRRIFGGVAFYAVRVLSNESRPLVLPRISCFSLSYCMLYYRLSRRTY